MGATQAWSSRAQTLLGESDNRRGKGWDCLGTGTRRHQAREGKARTASGDKKQGRKEWNLNLGEVASDRGQLVG